MINYRAFLALLFGEAIITPTRDEHGMFLAQAAALRSSSLSRQVGAAVLNAYGEVLALGVNEVPRYGGGQYWGAKGEVDGRDHVFRGYDSSDRQKLVVIREILEKLDPGWGKLSDEEKKSRLDEAAKTLEEARVANLTEFGRAVHAEMEAITSAARIGVSIRGATLFTTTFPCHGCAKHIVDAGIERVVYIEPYPKSLGSRAARRCDSP